MDVQRTIDSINEKLRSRISQHVYQRTVSSIVENNQSDQLDTIKSELFSDTDLLGLLFRIGHLNSCKSFDSNSDNDLISMLNLKIKDEKQSTASTHIHSIFRLLREEITYHAKSSNFPLPYEYSTSKFYRLPHYFHQSVLDKLSNLTIESTPSSIYLPGNKNGFIQLSSVSLASTSSYTFTIWLNITSITSKQHSEGTKGFVLFRCRSPCGGSDVILSDKNQDGSWQVIVRSFREMNPGTTSFFKEEIQGNISLIPNKWYLTFDISICLLTDIYSY